ncbi:hypothetical protein A3J56_03140 [Candidatus Giovannonibacteria bacterium RIFCSPHIGHO2_02_FULL_46_20]|uniref:ATP-dependent Clp protease proteolytic subunit n=1 Tax=Candidatus Giovannonibacteria bacterium RIFCSPHIGHO2_02_FULL_46_20 TaxID=1798338 RepID=A0A1F5WFA4_9BACT|nr:MAG: hypothetical protein A3J56_03140 [Candidatus Giovannonibacteria bacterium RIFCSPHIGHO2_02_FULL_46_20]
MSSINQKKSGRVYRKVKVCVSRRVIVIRGEIDVSMFAVLAIELATLQYCNLRPIVVIIKNSPGGDLFASTLIYMVLRESIAPVYTVIEDRAASAAVYVFLGGTKRFMVNGARLITHHSRSRRHRTSSLTPTERELILQEHRNKAIRILRRVLGISVTEARNYALSTNSLSARRARQTGFATQIISQKRLQNFYNNLSENL